MPKSELVSLYFFHNHWKKCKESSERNSSRLCKIYVLMCDGSFTGETWLLAWNHTSNFETTITEMNATLDLSFTWSSLQYFPPSFFFPSVFTQQNGEIALLACVCFLTCQKMLFSFYRKQADKIWQSFVGCEITHITLDFTASQCHF